MGTVHANLKLKNLFSGQSVEVRAPVDPGATFMCVTAEMAQQLGFDVSELSQQFVRTADGRQIKVPRIAPIEISFENRTHVTEAVVLGDEALMGVIPMEAMDLLVDPRTQQLIVNPEHPNYPVASAK
jgi:clan AA aspartic protease